VSIATSWANLSLPVPDEREISSSHKFYTSLSEDPPEEDEEEESDADFQPSLFRLSDEGGQLDFSVVSEGSIPRSLLDPSDGNHLRTSLRLAL